ncbi:threonine synthase [Lacticaseibacillus baoqingensis]|uniref:Threonine synthase n=1 Tax=Lacticaseibacillus baoqingensis TaxID=2486013 RepID=A0ABW4E5Q2_9LACO|nr:threonine synthase [Lacticaseibacillus baoqingensis]
MYTSTRDSKLSLTSQQALKTGFAPDGGLYVLPTFTKLDLEAILAVPYQEQAVQVLLALLPDFGEATLRQAVTAAYGDNFSDPQITPVHTVGETHYLELFHGPTSAFKDIGLQLLPRLLQAALAANDRVLILAATSGDTGKAALEGFKDVPQTGIATFYPDGGVSPIQERQMTTTGGQNTTVAAISGNFDDAQSAVKAMLNDHALQAQLSPVQLSVANSINIGRLAPQVVYYFAAYRQLVQAGTIQVGERVNFTVPTGNFGDVLAGYYAKQLGLPVNKFIVATNANSEVSDFLATGVYDRNRQFLKTSSPSMDIQISSNLERLLYYKSNGDSALVAQLMQSLADTGRYQVPADLLAAIQADFVGGKAQDTEVLAAIRAVADAHGYLMDPHTAVGYVVQQRLALAGPTVLLATASPFKFPQVVAEAALGEHYADGFEAMQVLASAYHQAIPQPLAQLADLPIRHHQLLQPAQMPEFVAQFAQEVL